MLRKLNYAEKDNKKLVDDTVHVTFSMDKKNIKDIETEEVDDGLLLKSIPVFKAGKHRGTEYTEKYIDNVLINQFDVKENVPVQADHSESYQDTLGYVKKLVRKGTMLYADMLLLADNAISRWKRGLMKKWSVGMYWDGRGLREISAVAFPYIKEASVLSETEDLSVGLKTVNIESENLPDDIEGKNGIIKYDEKEEKYYLEILNDSSNDCSIWTITYIDSLPDSAFALVKNPVQDKSRDRALPYRDKEGNIDKTHVINALVKINDVKGFSQEQIAKAKTTLDNIVKNGDIKVNTEEGDIDMDETKLNELAELKAKEMLKEASEKEEKLSEEIKVKDEKLAETLKEKKALEQKLDLSEVRETVATLKSEGKITPAEEESVVDFMAGLSKDQRVKYSEMLKKSDSKVNLDESGKQKSEKQEKDEFKMDFDEMEVEEVERVIEKYAEKKGIPVNDARDIFYEKNSAKK
uniref:Prohead protease n=1 Tax=viral metagenome TaxID=1070528 RepID=A0A6M3KC12_9ZZZZ